MDAAILDLGPDDLYVHLAADGGIFVAPGRDVHRTAGVTMAGLREQLSALPPAATVWLSDDAGVLTLAPATAVRDAGVAVQPAPAVLDTQRQGGTTALISAAYVGALDLLADLVARGAALADRDDRGGTALVAAAQAGQTAAVDRLVEAGADLEAADAEGTTALMYAAWSGHADTVRRLLDLGADPTPTRIAPGTVDGPMVDAEGLARGQDHAAAAAVLEAHRVAVGRPALADAPTAAVVTAPPAPARFVGRDQRWIFTACLVVAVILTGVLLVAGLATPSVVTVVVAVVVGLVAVLPLAWARSRYRTPSVAFANDRVDLVPAFGAPVSFAVGDVVRVRHQRNRGGLAYRVDLRGDSGRATVIPVTAVDPAVEGELLRRVAGVSGVEVDRRTETAIASLRP